MQWPLPGVPGSSAPLRLRTPHSRFTKWRDSASCWLPRCNRSRSAGRYTRSRSDPSISDWLVWHNFFPVFCCFWFRATPQTAMTAAEFLRWAMPDSPICSGLLLAITVFRTQHGLSHLRGRRVGRRGAFLQCPCKPRDPASPCAGRTFSQRVRLGRHDFPDRDDFGTGARRACLRTLSRAGDRLRRGHGRGGGVRLFRCLGVRPRNRPRAARSFQLEDSSRGHALHLA